eukprot:5272024-Karenia_brevis.AAC.1
MLHARLTRKPRKRKTQHSRRNHSSYSTAHYMDKLQQLLNDINLCNDLDQKCSQIEQALVEAGRDSNHLKESLQQANQPTSFKQCQTDGARLGELIKQRQATPHHKGQTRATLSKLIRKEIKAIKSSRRRQYVEHIINNFANLKGITTIKSRRKRTLIVKMVDDNGQPCHERESIAN